MANGTINFAEYCRQQNENIHENGAAIALGIRTEDEIRELEEVRTLATAQFEVANTDRATSTVDQILSILSITNATEETKIQISEVLRGNYDHLLTPPQVEAPPTAPSLIDLITTGLTSEEEVLRYLKQKQLIDLSDDKVEERTTRGLKYARSVFQKAGNFFKKRITSRSKNINSLESEFENPYTSEDIVNIFLTAAGVQQGVNKIPKRKVIQACALLRTALVINYIERDPTASARATALDQLKKLLFKYFTMHRNGSRGEWTFSKKGSKEANDYIKIVDLQIHEKELMEIVAKMLHKKEARPSDIKDMVRFRVLTGNAQDAFKLLNSLGLDKEPIFDRMQIRVADSEPKGMDPHALTREAIENPERAEDIFHKLADEKTNNDNGHSSSKYRGIHVVIDFPILLEDETVINFPIELQIMTQAAMTTNKRLAPHEEYKDSQANAITRRLTENNLATEHDKLEAQSKKKSSARRRRRSTKKS